MFTSRHVRFRAIPFYVLFCTPFPATVLSKEKLINCARSSANVSFCFYTSTNTVLEKYFGNWAGIGKSENIDLFFCLNFSFLAIIQYYSESLVIY